MEDVAELPVEGTVLGSQRPLSGLPCLHPRVNPRLEAGTLTKKWHMAYHGSHVAAVRRVLDRGELGAGTGAAGAGQGKAGGPGPWRAALTQLLS